MKTFRRMLRVLIVLGCLAIAGVAYMASNTVVPSSAGEGQGLIIVSSNAQGGPPTLTTPSFVAP